MTPTPALAAELRAGCAAIRDLFGAAACSCALIDDDGAALVFAAADGAGAAEITGVRLPVSRGIAGFVALSGQPVAIADVARDQRFARDVAEATAYVPTSVLAAPLYDAEGETLGVLEVLDPARGEEPSRLGGRRGSSAELGVLTVVAAQVAAVVRVAAGGGTTGDEAEDPQLRAALAAIRAAGPDRIRVAREVLAALASLAAPGGVER